LSTLHGRTHLWLHYWEVYKQRPLLGYGYAIGAREMGPVYATNTHNAIVSVLMACGLPGLAVLLWMLARYGQELASARRQSREGVVPSVALGVTALTNSMSLAFFGEGWTPVTFILACFFALHALHVAPPRAAPRGAKSRMRTGRFRYAPRVRGKPCTS
jgi:O-antigen ligase